MSAITDRVEWLPYRHPVRRLYRWWYKPFNVRIWLLKKLTRGSTFIHNAHFSEDGTLYPTGKCPAIGRCTIPKITMVGLRAVTRHVTLCDTLTVTGAMTVGTAGNGATFGAPPWDDGGTGGSHS